MELKTKFKNLNFIYLIWVCIFMVIALFIFQVNRYRLNDLDKLLALDNFREFEYSYDLKSWTPISFDEFRNLQPTDKSIYLRAPIAYATDNDYSFFIETHGLIFELYINDVLVYDFDNLTSAQSYIGTSWHTVPVYGLSSLDTNYATLHLYSPDNSFTNKLITFLYTETSTIFDFLSYISLFTSFFIAFFFSIGIILIFSALDSSRSATCFYYIGIEAILYALFVLSTFNPSSYITYNNTIFWQKLSMYSFYSLPIPTLLLFSSFREIKTLINFRVIAIINLLFILLIITLSIFNVSLINTDKYFFGYLILLSIYIIACCINSIKFVSFKQTYSLFMHTPSIFLPVVTCFNIILFVGSSAILYDSYYSFLNSNNFLLIFSLFLLFSLYGYVMYLRNLNYTYKANNLLIESLKINLRETINLQSSLQKLDSIQEVIDYAVKNFDANFIKNHSMDLDIETKDTFTFNPMPIITAPISFVFIINDTSIDGFEADPKDPRPKIVGGTGDIGAYTGLYLDETLDEKLEKIPYLLSSSSSINKNETFITSKDNSLKYGVFYITGLNSLSSTQRANFLSSMNTMYSKIKNTILKLETLENQQNMIFNLTEIVESKSQETGFHVKRVAIFSRILCEKLGLSQDLTDTIYIASSMHDIGKLKVPDSVLHKNGALNNEEFALIKRHTIDGYSILSQNSGDIFEMASEIALYHHEKYNGKGYIGVTGENIPLAARIVGLADVVDALKTTRSYKKPWSNEDICDLVRREDGQHFDPTLVKIFFDNYDEFIAIYDKYGEDVGKEA